MSTSTVSDIIQQYSDEPYVDAEQIEMLTMVDEEDSGGGLVAELFGLFKSESDPKLDQLAEICASNDSAQLRKIVHFIAGSAGNIGLNQLSLALRRVEEGIDSGEIEDITGAEDPIRNVYERSCSYMVENHGV
jgi:FOG: HPt domain